MNFKLQIFVIFFMCFVEYGTSSISNNILKRKSHRPRSSDKPLALSLKPEYSEYLLKIAPYEETDCSGLKKISPEYSSVLKIKEADALEMNNSDLMQCQIVNSNYNESPESRLVIHTTGSTSDGSGVMKFSNPSTENCFSFTVQTSKNKQEAKIYLYNDLHQYKYIIIALGTVNNTHSFLGDNQHLCRSCAPKETEYILSSITARGFWISWDSHNVHVGKETETEPFLSQRFVSGVGTIRFIGLSTPGDHAYGTWSLKEPFCPYILKRPKTERLVEARCHKVFDSKTVLLSSLSKEIKLLERVKALDFEFSVEISTTQVTGSRIIDYYYYNLDTLYFEDYMNLYQNCKNDACGTEISDILTEIDTKITDLRKKLQDHLKEITLLPTCPSNSHFDVHANKCKCNKGYAGDGYYCELDSDEDGFPDDYITECYEKPECRKDNCPHKYNPNQDNVCHLSHGHLHHGTDIPYIPDIHPRPHDEYESWNCAVNITTPTFNVFAQKCNLESDFLIPPEYQEDTVEILFKQENSKDIYKFTWSNKNFKLFKLNKLKNPNEKDDDDEPSMHYKTNLIWNRNIGQYFNLGKSYRLVLSYQENKLQIRLDGSDNFSDNRILDSNPITIDGMGSKAITKLCAKSKDIKWIRHNHECEADF